MKYLRWIGLALSLVGIGFVISQLASYASDLGDFRPNFNQLVVFSILTAIYGAANVALASRLARSARALWVDKQCALGDPGFRRHPTR